MERVRALIDDAPLATDRTPSCQHPAGVFRSPLRGGPFRPSRLAAVPRADRAEEPRAGTPPSQGTSKGQVGVTWPESAAAHPIFASPRVLADIRQKRTASGFAIHQNRTIENGRTEGQGPLAQDRPRRAWVASSPSRDCVRGAWPSTARPSTSPTPIRPGDGANCLPAAASSAPRSSGSGIFKDAQSDASIRSKFFAAEIVDWQLAIPGFGTVEGPFQITALEYAGNHDGEVTFEIGLESAGASASRWRHER